MSEINFCNTKEQLNHLGEVVTGKVDGSPSGADIDTSTLPYTGQVRKTLPSLEAEYEQSITSKEVEADAAIDEYRLLNKGPYAAGITLESKFEYITYNGESYFATNPPYITTATTPDADGNLFAGGYLTSQQLSLYTDIVYKASGSNSAVENMISGLNLNPLMYAIGTCIKTGGTTWEYADSTGDITVSNFRAFNTPCLLDFSECNGVFDDTENLEFALSSVGSLVLPVSATLRVTSKVRIPTSFKELYGGGVVLFEGDGCFQSADPAVAETKSVTFDNAETEIDLGGDYTGKYVRLSNNLTWFVSDAESASPDTIDAISLTESDYNYQTEREGLYYVEGYNTQTGMSVLAKPTNFNAVSGTAEIMNEVNTVRIDGLTLIDDTDKVFTINLNTSYGSSITNCKSESCNEISYSYWNTDCNISNNTFNTRGGVRVYRFSRGCAISSNVVNETSQESDGAIVIYYGSCENSVTGNVITVNGNSLSRWGVLFHSSSDSNTAAGNTIRSTGGVCDFLANKGNVFSGNTIYGMAGTSISYYCHDTLFVGNAVRDLKTISMTGSTKVDIKANSLTTSRELSGDVVFSSYDSGGKPFGYDGFVSKITGTVSIYGNTAKCSSKDGSNIDDFVTYQSGVKPVFDKDGFASGSVGFVGSTLSRWRKLNLDGNNIINFDYSVLISNNDGSNVPTEVRSEGNIYQDSTVAILGSIDSVPNSNIVTSSNDTFRDVHRATMTNNYSIYVKGATGRNISALMMVCGDVASAYSYILDIDNSIDNDTYDAVYYYFGGQFTSYYAAGNRDNQVHSLASVIPVGAQYYQYSDDYTSTQSYLFINRRNIFSGSGAGSTIKRTLTEVSLT